MNRVYTDYLRDILDAIEKIESFTFGLSYDEFIRDSKTIYAVTRALEIIGEAATKIPEDFRAGTENIPWKSISGMRNKLIHEYFGINVKVIWKTIHEDISPLKKEIEKNLPLE